MKRSKPQCKIDVSRREKCFGVNSVANYITISRIILSLSLLLTEPLSFVFFVIYFFCGMSDVLDGYIARKTATTSKMGEKLDSAADLVMVAVLIIILYPIINPPAQILAWVIVIGLIRAMSLTVVFLKHRTFTILHTYGNKATGLVLFAIPFTLPFGQANLIMYIACLVASISAIEELFIHLTSSKGIHSN